ncbi:Uncharacterized protein LHYA1_G003089 [Lachnellula hyalina]|uniref:NAD-dependent epimerase/dehydratase domain-containing protein n=1 Tax=Lachnellula hyalina TaxID=1316788 RepID=A0A8H8R3M7_9HELO|nr:Uncharacterized protein LHYA1_G003089 [Lachnellula hyalina]TVY27824.1 Uncharacterized protein LHYA1_G003089 [Lachnellula hyalina]
MGIFKHFLAGSFSNPFLRNKISKSFTINLKHQVSVALMSSKILLTGATGYIGGSILTQLLESKHDFSKYPISVLVRGEDRAKILQGQGFNPILFHNLDETDILQKVASEHDVVIHTASGFHTASAKALILGLGERKKASGKEVHFIHTSGTSNLGDQPISGKYLESRTFSDRENIYAYLKSREALQVYPQRTTDIIVVETGLAAGVKTTILMSPTIYGFGTGLFNKLSIQFPTLLRAAIKAGQSEMIGDGKGVWSYVHIADLARLYELLLNKVLKGEELPNGEKGILFSSTGSYQWAELASDIAGALAELGAIKTREVKSISLSEAAGKWWGGYELIVELSFASNSRTLSDVSHELGWREEKTEQDFKNQFLEEARLVVAAQ